MQCKMCPILASLHRWVSDLGGISMFAGLNCLWLGLPLLEPTTPLHGADCEEFCTTRTTTADFWNSLASSSHTQLLFDIILPHFSLSYLIVFHLTLPYLIFCRCGITTLQRTRYPLPSVGVLAAVHVARAGFPVRMQHGEFVKRYGLLAVNILQDAWATARKDFPENVREQERAVARYTRDSPPFLFRVCVCMFLLISKPSHEDLQTLYNVVKVPRFPFCFDADSRMCNSLYNVVNMLRIFVL